MKTKNLSQTLLLAAIAMFCAGPVNAQDAGTSDRTDGSFEVPGWFSKNQSDIARYPVPLITPQDNTPSTAPLVVLQKFGPPGSPLTKSILTPTPFGFQQRSLSSVPWGGFGGGGFGGYSPTPYYGGGFPAATGWMPSFGGYGGYGSGYGIGSIPGLGVIPGLGGLGSIGRIGGFGGFGGFGGYGAPFMGASPFGFGSPGFGMGHASRTIIVQPSESKNLGNNYYTPPAANSSGSGYYSSGTPYVQPNAVTIPPRQSPKDYWGDSGNPFGTENLNKTPW